MKQHIIKYDYITSHSHDKYSSGTSCKAWRDEFSIIWLEFADECIINIGSKWYLKGIESNLVSACEIEIIDRLASIALTEIKNKEDREFFNDLSSL
jgi:hypothetical protein